MAAPIVYGLLKTSPSHRNGNGKRCTLGEAVGENVGSDRWGRNQHSALSEAFRGLRTSVLLSAAGRPPRSLTFVSAEPGEGKTTVASNLSISLAQLGKRVLLIDGDMRRPCVHKLFHIEDRFRGPSHVSDWGRRVEALGSSHRSSRSRLSDLWTSAAESKRIIVFGSHAATDHRGTVANTSLCLSTPRRF